MKHSSIFHKKIAHRQNQGSGEVSHEHSKLQHYYWIWFDRDESHKGLWGAYRSYEEAERKAVSKLNVPYEVVKLNTRDETEAGRILRSRMLGETGDVEKTFNRFSHKGGEDG